MWFPLAVIRETSWTNQCYNSVRLRGWQSAINVGQRWSNSPWLSGCHLSGSIVCHWSHRRIHVWKNVCFPEAVNERRSLPLFFNFFHIKDCSATSTNTGTSLCSLSYSSSFPTEEWSCSRSISARHITSPRYCEASEVHITGSDRFVILWLTPTRRLMMCTVNTDIYIMLDKPCVDGMALFQICFHFHFVFIGVLPFSDWDPSTVFILLSWEDSAFDGGWCNQSARFLLLPYSWIFPFPAYSQAWRTF